MEYSFITPSDVKNYTQISKNVDDKQLDDAILLAQINYIKPILGESLYGLLQSELGNNTVTDDNRNLLDEIVRPLAYYSWYEAMPFIVFQTRRSGMVARIGDDAETISDVDRIEYYRISIRKYAIKYINDLKKFLDDNIHLYSQFEENQDNRILDKNHHGLFLYDDIDKLDSTSNSDLHRYSKLKNKRQDKKYGG